MKKYKFIKPYTTKVTVGGFVGTTQRTFKVGEVYSEVSGIYSGNTAGGKIISLRIAEDNIPGPPTDTWHDVFINVPAEYLALDKTSAIWTPALKWTLGIGAGIALIAIIIKLSK